MSVLPLSKPANPLQKYNFQWVTSGNNGNIYYNGNVGINTRSDPQYNLDVSGTSNISGDSLLRGNLTLLSDASFNGNLYVGQDIYIKNQKVTTGPSSQWTDNNGNIYYSGNTLSIGSDTNGQIYVGDTNGLILQKNSPDAYIRNLQASGKLYLGTQTTNSVTIDASNLNVAGTITANHNFKNIPNLNLTNSNNRIFFVSNLGLGGYNNISSENSCGIFWGDSLSGGSVTNNFVIAPWKNSSLTEGIAITPSGNVGIRQSNPLYTLDVNGNLNVGQNLYIKGTQVISSQFSNRTNGNIYYNGNVEIINGSLFFTNNLNCNIGTTDVYNAIYYPLKTYYDNSYWETTEIASPSSTIGLTNWIRISKNGNRIYRYSNTTSFDSLSDLNSKKDIVIANYDRCFEIINSIELKRFTYDEDIVPDSKNYDDKYRLGFIAQDLETVFPKSVMNALDTSGNTTLKSINVDQINMALYGCVKSLIQKISKIQNENKELESKVTLLESQISDILQRL